MNLLARVMLRTSRGFFVSAGAAGATYGYPPRNLRHQLLGNEPSNRPRLWVDADGCPAPVKEMVFRTAQRRQIETILVANQSIWVPASDLIRRMTVPDGADVADNAIIEHLRPGDVVITGDIPLASRVVEQGGIAIGVRGELYDDKSVHGRLASRNLMEQLRSSGMETAGPKPFDQKDAQSFANQLDRTLTRLLKRVP